ncbi:MAG: hypothetical protein KDD11_04745 [Acidobacteria bacterium]|nr:hypothetical protein [Acidobacteriota bacterium]
MKFFPRSWTIRILLAAVLLAALSIPFLGSSSEAAIAGPSICVYYSDATHTTAVGARGRGCCGEVISWGITSPYVHCERLYCPTVICPQ